MPPLLMSSVFKTNEWNGDYWTNSLFFSLAFYFLYFSWHCVYSWGKIVKLGKTYQGSTIFRNLLKPSFDRYYILGQVKCHGIRNVFPAHICFLINSAKRICLLQSRFWLWRCYTHVHALCYLDFGTLLGTLSLWLNKLLLVLRHASLALAYFANIHCLSCAHCVKPEGNIS